MCESKIIRCVALEDVVDSDTFRLSCIEAEFTFPEEPRAEDIEQA